MCDKETMLILKMGKQRELKSKNCHKDVCEGKSQKDDNEPEVRKHEISADYWIL